MKKTFVVRIITIIMVTLALIIGSITLLSGFSNKVIHTFHELYIISDSINFINEQPIKTDSMHDTASKLMTERESLYQSSDWTVSAFANLGTVSIIGNLLQFLIVILALSMYFFVFIMWLFLVINHKKLVHIIFN